LTNCSNVVRRVKPTALDAGRPLQPLAMQRTPRNDCPACGKHTGGVEVGAGRARRTRAGKIC
jgi:hypothetical protein